eukprot:6834961-Prorocentrum_lima.AAC.1
MLKPGGYHGQPPTAPLPAAETEPVPNTGGRAVDQHNEGISAILGQNLRQPSPGLVHQAGDTPTITVEKLRNL